MDSPAAVDNPYVAVVGRKMRNLKKKMEKIAKAEAQFDSGKVLDEEQKILLSTKPQVEKSLADLSSIKSQLEEVVKQEQSDAHEPAPHMTNGYNPMAQDKLITTKVHKLVKFLHVYESYAHVTGKDLPAMVTQFGQVLLGLHKSVGGGRVDERLAEGSRAADAYLNDALASKTDIDSKTTYADLGKHVDVLMSVMQDTYRSQQLMKQQQQQQPCTNPLLPKQKNGKQPVAAKKPAAVSVEERAELNGSAAEELVLKLLTDDEVEKVASSTVEEVAWINSGSSAATEARSENVSEREASNAAPTKGLSRRQRRATKAAAAATSTVETDKELTVPSPAAPTVPATATPPMSPAHSSSKLSRLREVAEPDVTAVPRPAHSTFPVQFSPSLPSPMHPAEKKKRRKKAQKELEDAMALGAATAATIDQVEMEDPVDYRNDRNNINDSNSSGGKPTLVFPEVVATGTLAAGRSRPYKKQQESSAALVPPAPAPTPAQTPVAASVATFAALPVTFGTISDVILPEEEEPPTQLEKKKRMKKKVAAMTEAANATPETYTPLPSPAGPPPVASTSAPLPTAVPVVPAPVAPKPAKRAVPNVPTPNAKAKAKDFDENLYTKPLDLNQLTAAQIAEAERLARDIESKSSYHSGAKRGAATVSQLTAAATAANANAAAAESTGEPRLSRSQRRKAKMAAGTEQTAVSIDTTPSSAPPSAAAAFSGAGIAAPSPLPPGLPRKPRDAAAVTAAAATATSPASAVAYTETANESAGPTKNPRRTKRKAANAAAAAVAGEAPATAAPAAPVTAPQTAATYGEEEPLKMSRKERRAAAAIARAAAKDAGESLAADAPVAGPTASPVTPSTPPRPSSQPTGFGPSSMVSPSRSFASRAALAGTTPPKTPAATTADDSATGPAPVTTQKLALMNSPSMAAARSSGIVANALKKQKPKGAGVAATAPVSGPTTNGTGKKSTPKRDDGGAPVSSGKASSASKKKNEKKLS